MISAEQARAISELAEIEKRVIESASKGGRYAIHRGLGDLTKKMLQDKGFCLDTDKNNTSTILPAETIIYFR